MLYECQIDMVITKRKKVAFMPFSHLKGRKLMLCDMIYHRPSKLTEYHDYLSVVYKDLVTSKKELLTIRDPEFTIYEVKEEHRTFKKARHYIEKEKCIPHVIKYKDLYKEIADIAGEPYQTYYRTHKSNYERRTLFKYPYILGADISIETYYRVIWEQQLGLEDGVQRPITTQYLDIEVNQKHWTGAGICRNGECPIDAVTIVDDCTNTAYTFLLKVPDNPQIDEFIKPENIAKFQKALHDEFDDVYGVLTYNIYMFEHELEMIKKIFTLIHSLKRDFIMIWNMSFDIPYIIARITELGGNPLEIMCHSDFPVQQVYFKEDVNTFEFSEKRDYFEISSYTHYIDQLIQYASLRKSKGAIKKVNLGAVGQAELGDTKLDYTDVGNFIEFSYQNYWKYVMYNIKDVLLQMGIDRKCKDMTNYYLSVYNSFCAYKDGLKQTVSLRGLVYKELIVNYDMVLGNNINFTNQAKKKKNEDDDDDSYEGALNGDSMLNDYMGLEIFGKKSMFIFGDSIDLDFSAMYPNSICVFNIFAETMIGKLIITNCEDKLTYTVADDDDDNVELDGGKEFVEDITSGNEMATGEKWFSLPSFDEVAREVQRRMIG